MKLIATVLLLVLASCASVKPVPGATLHVDSYYLTPCDTATKLPVRPVTAAEVLAAHTKTVQALSECSAKQAGAAELLKGLSK